MKEHKGYRSLKAWEKATNLAHKIYDVTNDFPKSELFALTSQMRRAAVSVPANIAEGYSRKGIKEKRHFYSISLSSLAELEFYIDFSRERNYYKKSIHQDLINLQTETAKILTGLINYLERTH